MNIAKLEEEVKGNNNNNNTMDIISKHLCIDNLDIKIYKVNSVCAFTGMKITEGILMNDLIKKTFTDHELIKFNSNYASIDIALMLENFEGRRGLRNFSFYADENELQLLKREKILELLFNIKNIPFKVGITYSGKKHIAYKAPINFNTKNFLIITDLGIVNFENKKAIEIIKIAQKWYTVLPNKENTESKPTYFTKEQIKGNSMPNHKQITDYGLQKYFKESQELEKFRGTVLFNLIIHCLNKKV